VELKENTLFLGVRRYNLNQIEVRFRARKLRARIRVRGFGSGFMV